MALFVMGDLHLSLSVNKPMDIFGGWDSYMERIKENWTREVSEEDTIVIPGDISWAISLAQAEPDFRFIHE
ncbi:MAG: serine/threonine protein phosphatase, partial [Huintestinicola sp.]